MKSCTVTLSRHSVGFDVADDGGRFPIERAFFGKQLDLARREQIARVRYYEALGYAVRVVDETSKAAQAE